MVGSVFVLILTASCGGGGGEVDAPCEIDDDCEDGLECDLHDGAGTCQEVHDD